MLDQGWSACSERPLCQVIASVERGESSLIAAAPEAAGSGAGDTAGGGALAEEFADDLAANLAGGTLRTSTRPTLHLLLLVPGL
jgi:hypothetical protein